MKSLRPTTLRKEMLFSLFTFALFASINCFTIVWVHESLDEIPIHPSIGVDYLTWGSTGVLTLLGQKSMNIKSANSQTIQKSFTIQIPHAELAIQFQAFEAGCLTGTEGFELEVSTAPGTLDRYSSSNPLIGCAPGEINVYIQRFTFPEVEQQVTVYLSSIFDNPFQSVKTVSINNFKIGVVACEPSCAKCKLTPSPNLNASTICEQCPENASFLSNSNLCSCKANYSADYSLGYLTCKVNMDVPDNQITQACRTELNNYSSRTRVNILTSESMVNGVSTVSAHIDFSHFFSDITVSCASQIRNQILKFNTQTNVFDPLGAKYIITLVQGDYIDIAFSLSEFPSLATVVYHEGDKTIYSIRLALQFKVGSSVPRTHEFNIIYQINGDNSHSTSAFNSDYQKNMNFISLASFGNSASFVKEYLLEIKRYLCTNSSCLTTRSQLGFSKHEQIITKIQFISSLTKSSLTLEEAHIYGNNQQFDIKSAISILNQGQGYLIASVYQDFIITLINNQQATNKVYLQFTISYLDNPSNPNSKRRYGQVVILIYALFTGV